uniref:Phosphoglycerate kinase n=1 Tax=Chromera velia CCMP2878 TaxID=1169474 RepID=A0A0G4GI49_9ALVE|mmetsp:Transcript_40897/g.80588  ORF Transcript_40897/g.80588 Transcript_40897/m.80588 type:complete len:666 (+) Transcript_40897:176-2173(+)|eukprot:Cvel_21993.t1-p1 / transcript=Cvel_21993.t1 / gene=Cvel_21993 / organism=Chromera_velia_CCMP2878 / gene_product=Phosphoglycerate kinase, chloroplastic, putative / transcript_product=Phosphoglycerate kinase, chloroplastic, putative / location=Cvel_scaffold2119:1849-6375(-) / protein_length=665 / sequence_SO=supercontig / SO=protein_coding / is_pseudo=false
MRFLAASVTAGCLVASGSGFILRTNRQGFDNAWERQHTSLAQGKNEAPKFLGYDADTLAKMDIKDLRKLLRQSNKQDLEREEGLKLGWQFPGPERVADMAKVMGANPKVQEAMQQAFSDENVEKIHKKIGFPLDGEVSEAILKTPMQLPKNKLNGKKILVRVDFNVPLSQRTDPNIGEYMVVDDPARIVKAGETIKYLVEAGAKVAMCSHLGRPKGQKTKKDSLQVAIPTVEESYKVRCKFVDDCLSPELPKMLDDLDDGECLLLENVRFYNEEEKNDPEFAKKLAAPFDMFVNDAFGAAHRAHASTEGVTKYLSPNLAGALMNKEVMFFKSRIESPSQPFAAIVGGSKVSSKIAVLKKLVEKVDKLIVGGGMVFTFLKARGLQVGNSLVEDDQIGTAKEIEALCKAKGVELILPTDVVVSSKGFEKGGIPADADVKVVPVDQIPASYAGFDNGPETTDLIVDKLQDCKLIIWNGPMGVFEDDRFAEGTMKVAEALADLTTKGAETVIGGGDSGAAVEKAGVAEDMTHVSTGGGASLELLEGKALPGVDALEQNRPFAEWTLEDEENFMQKLQTEYAPEWMRYVNAEEIDSEPYAKAIAEGLDFPSYDPEKRFNGKKTMQAMLRDGDEGDEEFQELKKDLPSWPEIVKDAQKKFGVEYAKKYGFV